MEVRQMAASDSNCFMVNVSSVAFPNTYAKISPEDAEIILRHKWSVTTVRRYRIPEFTRYARAAVPQEDGRVVQVKMHRLILTAPDGIHVDHINGDGLDNRRENLRLASPQENQANSRKRVHGQSRFKGVAWSSGANKWRAYISPDRKQIHLGRYLESGPT
jgi:hypothetical protein